MKNPKQMVAVSMRIIEASGYHELRDAISDDWSALFSPRDKLPIFLPNTWDIAREYFLEFPIAAVILTGGNSLGRIFGGEDPSEGSAKRDGFEKILLDYAVRHQIPVLGVCRGMQVINAYFGGTLKRVAAASHVAVTHSIVIKEEFRGVLGGFSKVNSFHDYGIGRDSAGKGLVPFASSEDGIVEGVVHSEFPILGMMWHPERDGGSPELFFRILDQLINNKVFWKEGLR